MKLLPFMKAGYVFGFVFPFPDALQHLKGMKDRGKKGVLQLKAAAQAIGDKGSAGFHGQFVKNRPANGKGMVMKVFF